MPYGYQSCSKLLFVSMLAGIFLLSSCDAITEPDITSSDEEPFSKEAARTTTASTGDTELFNCYVSQLTADGTYVEKLAKFPLPTSLGWTENDELTVALYRNVFPGTTITTRIANCRIPDHPDAINYLADLLEADFVGTLGVDTFSDEDCGDDVAFCGDLEGIEVTASRCDNETALTCGGDGSGYIGWHWDDIFDDWDDGNPHEWEPVGGDPEEPCEDCLPPEPCEKDDNLVDSSVFAEGAQQLWAASNFDAPQAYREEQIGIFSPQPSGDWSFQMYPEHWITGAFPCHINLKVGPGIPDGSILIHTHPFKEFELVYVCGIYNNRPWRPGPSKADKAFLDLIEEQGYASDVEGIVIDNETIIRFSSEGVISEYSRCGF